MATRRPKVPRATPAAPKSPDTGDGGDVIQADFRNSHQPAAAGRTSRQDPVRPDSAQPVTARPGTAKPGTRPGAPGASGPSHPGSPTRPGSSAPGHTRYRTARPGAAKPTGNGASAEENHDPVPAKAFSGRTLALFVVMIAITIMLAPTVKIFFEKRAEIAALEADISAQQDQQSDLRRQVSRWQDPNYVKQQARDRINMVMPGETGYWVFGSDLPAGSSGAAAGEGSQQDPAELPWVDSLWESVRRSATD
jgi:cell division protein FtsB